MAKEHFHTIHKQVIEITTDSAMDAKEIEDRYKELVLQINSRSFEDCFDDLVEPHQHLFIERMEIDLGKMNKKFLFNSFGTRLGQALRTALLKKLAKESLEAKDLNRRPVKLHNSQPGGLISQPSGALAPLSEPFEVFLFFLEKGRLPSWVPYGYRLGEEWVEGVTDEQFDSLRKLAYRSERAMLRLVSTFSVRFIIILLERFEPITHVVEHWNWIDANLLSDDPHKLLFKKNYWFLVLSICIAHLPGEMSKVAEGEILLKAFQILPRPLLITLTKVMNEKTVPDTLQEPLRRSLDLLLSESEPQAEKYNPNAPSPFEEKAATQHNAIRSDPAATIDPLVRKKSLERNAQVVQDEISGSVDPLWVNNAGLVLLSPFLREVFQSCRLLENGDFKSPEMMARAVNLLVYLANGNEDLPEYEKLLPKLLCGVLWETFLPEVVPISDTEMSEANELLIAVVNHWKALRNSSPEALQEVFIRRSGILMPGNPGIQLTVERKTQDVLLSHLPWGYAMVKLPWMPEILMVKWT